MEIFNPESANGKKEKLWCDYIASDEEAQRMIGVGTKAQKCTSLNHRKMMKSRPNHRPSQMARRP